MPFGMNSDLQLNLLGLLGAPRVALQKAADGVGKGNVFVFAPFFGPNLVVARTDPTFTSVAEQAGLMKYWKATHTKPDVCSDKNPPSFCSMI